jgi:hypothetical protein
LLAAVFALVLLPMAPGATAQTDTAVIDTPTVSSVSSGQITDSSGVPLSNYVFATNHGSLFNPQNFGMSSVDEINFGLWEKELEWSEEVNHAAVTGGVPQAIGSVLTKVADRFSSQLAISSVLIVCMTIGAFFVAYFIVRGFHAKATMQVVTMILVAMIGPLFLAHPLSDALSSNGLLAQGQNLGISLAAGFNGTPTTEPNAMQTSMEHDMVDQFGRYPLQVWNFGQVVDNSASCKAAWTRGAMVSNEDEIKNGMKSCGDNAAYSLASNPTASQMGQGFIMVVIGLFELLFQFYLFWVIVWAFFRAVWSAGCAIIGFAGSGFVYGPPQIFLIRSVVEGFVAAGAMVGYIALDGGYELFVGDLFDVAQGQTTVVMILCVFMPILAFTQLRHMRKGMESANDFIANRFGQAAQGVSAGGGGGGRALGMGNAAAGNSLSGFKLMAGLTAANALSSNFAFEWLADGTPNFLHPLSRKSKRSTNSGNALWENRRDAARLGVTRYGGINSYLGAGALIESVLRHGGSLSDAPGAANAIRWRNDDVLRHVMRSWSTVDANAADYILSDQRLGRAVAGIQRVSDSANRFVSGNGHQSAAEVAADISALQAAAFIYRRANSGGVTLHNQAQHDFVDAYMGVHRPGLGHLPSGPNKDMIENLKELAAGDPHAIGTKLGVNGMTGLEAQRVKTWIGNEHAKRVFDATQHLVQNPSDYAAIRNVREELSMAQRTDSFMGGVQLTQANTLAPPDPRGSTPHPDWISRMSQVAPLLRNRVP